MLVRNPLRASASLKRAGLQTGTDVIEAILRAIHEIGTTAEDGRFTLDPEVGRMEQEDRRRSVIITR